MSPIDLSALSSVQVPSIAILAASAAGFYVIIHVLSVLYQAYFGPLSKFPGPPLRAISLLPGSRTIWKGDGGHDVVALHEKYGPIVRVGPRELSFNGGAQAWKDIYGFKKAGQPSLNKDSKFYMKLPDEAYSIINANDANHTRQRKLLSHAFADKSLKDLEPMLKQWTEKMRSKLAEFSGTGLKLDLLKYYNCTTFDIMGDLSFNESLNMLEDSEYSPWVKTIFASTKMGTRMRSIFMLHPALHWFGTNVLMSSPTVAAKRLEHKQYSSDRVDRRLKRTPDRPDLWSKIMERSKGPDALALEEHYVTASLFMVAGTETTATALSGTTYHLLRDPPTFARLAAELRAAYASDAEVSLDSLARLPYLDAVLREGLRMYPPVPIGLPRITPAGGAVIAGQYVPAQVAVSVHQLATYRNPALFAEPNVFRPERWLSQDGSAPRDQLDALEPFSTGPRNCIGKNLAWHEMRLLLATTVRNFDLQLHETAYDWADQKIFTLWEKKPLWVTLTAANKAS